MDYSSYQDLKIRSLEPGILEIVMGEEGKLAIATARAHGEMARVWLDVDRDAETRVAILRGAGKGFSAGGDMAMVDEMTRDFSARARVWREARDLVYNMLNCSKIIISAIHGPAVGAGLAAALMADISIAAKGARLIDGHTRLGVAAGDHAAIIWPLLCGMAKAKYYLLTCDTVSGEEAERIGLVSLACDEDAVAGEGARGRAQARRRPADRAALDQVLAQQLAAHGRPGVRCLARDGDHGLHRSGGEGRSRLAAREAAAELSARAEGLLGRLAGAEEAFQVAHHAREYRAPGAPASPGERAPADRSAWDWDDREGAPRSAKPE